MKSEPPLVDKHSLFPTATDEDWDNWKWQFANRIKTTEQLRQLLSFDVPEVDTPLAITPYYLSLMRDPSDPLDPISLQCVPDQRESVVGGYSDPLHEEEQMPVIDGQKVYGLVHRYPDRVLLITTDICPVLCRHCTRRREWYKGMQPRTPAQMQLMLKYIRKNPQIRDVIISGGDPLTLPLRTLDYLLTELRSIEHVEMIRIGTRYPAVLPQRFFEQDILDVLSKHAPIWLNTHFNHVREVRTPEVKRAVSNIIRSGCVVSNQAVLLKGVNDSVEAMTDLSHALLKNGIRFYYLFQADKVEGTHHFWTDVDKGKEIVKGMRGFTSGLGIPQFVVDAEGLGKIPVNPNYEGEDDGHRILRNYQGKPYYL